MEYQTRPNQIDLIDKNKMFQFFVSYVIEASYDITFFCLPYLVILTNGTKATVNNVPNEIPATNPIKFCCHGRVPIPNNEPAIKISLTKAMCGFFNCFQWISISSTISDETTPAREANGPT